VQADEAARLAELKKLREEDQKRIAELEAKLASEA